MDSTSGQDPGATAPGEVKGTSAAASLLGRIREPFSRIPRRSMFIGLGALGLVVALGILAFVMGVFGDSSPPPQAGSGTPAAGKPAPVAARPAVAPPPKPAAVAVVEAPKQVPIVAPAPVAAAPVAIAPAAPRTRQSAARPSTRVSHSHARRERAMQPLPVARVAPPEPRIYTPRYNDVMTAVLKPDREGVAELLDLGRWVDKPDSNGVTPLQAAVRNRDMPMTELLLKRGANVNASGPDGVTALSIARANGDAAMVSRLRGSGAK